MEQQSGFCDTGELKDGWLPVQLTIQPKTDDEAEVQVSGASIQRLCKIEVAFRRGSLVVQDVPIRWKTTQEQVGMVHEKQLK